ncbi:phage baseplate assembly protein W [Dysgonomonas sp. PFB1-18]|uniref:GPW/gp25 family protein n=1 Tax=unclassified Dysgonomonas TaxID=2630389 RepID=UPI0024742CDB|nr:MULTISPECIES: GPW/gp25 family protein [unclassified Dysgonomonas]MDH6311107.1 phage baseplate assembly protein W [Dysgonomonas sp. PF1-14]MDH6340975.1 phage baseplate assembly protein W [Dysgonomonas sp. PF1-16]MDH6382634.1 phage baseplate assembly protein W [Dysgonomonas sp. PFB1-18]MDH6399981.1 phage baseplate assembly protein W [Dysgonomonas sp. PF1-23]
MRNNFYKLPIRFDSIFDEKGGDMPMCSEIESIDQHIELLLTTCPGEHQFDKNFGCRIWDMDFERVVSRQKWEDDFKRYILEAIQKFEQRLRDVTVSIHIMEVVREDLIMKATAIKKKVIVQVNGKLASTNDRCGFKYTLFLGPLSAE